MYFKNFPEIYYGFPTNDGSDLKLQILKDITSNVRFRKQIFENITLYDEYDIEEGQTIEMIAEKIYGNPEYHWIIMLFNEKYNYADDYPMTEVELNTYINDTYGDARYATHHYEVNDELVIPKQELTIKATTTINSLYYLSKVGDTIKGVESGATGIIASMDREARTFIVQLVNEPFIAGETLEFYGLRFNEGLDRHDYSLYAIEYVVESIRYTEDIKRITNEEVEMRINESKRRIKLISPELVSQIITEFEDLL